MAHYKLTLAYDGSQYAGFQRQKNRRTIQAEFEHALRTIGWTGLSILGAGRTDSGVHASGQVVSFDLNWRHSDQDLLRALNANLPEDIAVQEIQQAASGFHPRYDALARVYTYRLLLNPLRQPLMERYAWRVWPAPDLEIMRAASEQLVGVHDFKAYGSPHRKGSSTHRQIYQARWFHPTAAEFVFEVIGNAFLYHMVRRIVYLLVEVGQGKVDIEQVKTTLQDEESSEVVGLAPAAGLCLSRVVYHKADLPE
jgi:tRNA pseudouridine38-40 synthase